MEWTDYAEHRAVMDREWTDRHQQIYDRLDLIDPIGPAAERRYAEHQAEQDRIAAVRARREQGEELRNVRARLAGAIAAGRRRMTPDPGGIGAMWGALAREPDRGERFTARSSDYWTD